MEMILMISQFKLNMNSQNCKKQYIKEKSLTKTGSLIGEDF